MIVSGLGFNPRAKNNTMWIRFVDPVTSSELSTPYSVKAEDLLDD